MKQGLLRTIMAISTGTLLNLATIGCSGDNPVTPAINNDAPSLSLSGRNSTDNSVRFVRQVVDVDLISRSIQFGNMTDRVSVAVDADIRVSGAQSTKPGLTLKDIVPGMYLDAIGQLLDHDKIVLKTLIVVPADRYHAGFERVDPQ